MDRIKYSATFLFLLLVFLMVFFYFVAIDTPSTIYPKVFVGVDVAYDDVERITLLVDEISSYTNFFVIGSTGITYDIPKLDKVCQYLYEKGLYFTIFFHINSTVPQSQWIKDAGKRWGDRFLGLYAYDEPGGHQIDNSPYLLVKNANNYSDAANSFITQMGGHLKNIREYPIFAGDIPLMTSDYCLYWFDYKAGYDIVLCEFGWNHSRLLNIALCRGAANLLDKEWGVMITWTYNHPPYIESGEELYNDMVLAYKNGAKYIVIFNYPKVSDYGILNKEHLNALKKFWHFMDAQREEVGYAVKERVAYVLPKDYGFGFRSHNDTIWGMWEADDLSKKIWCAVNFLLKHYGFNLDIIYEDETCYERAFTLYNKLIFWNRSIFWVEK